MRKANRPSPILAGFAVALACTQSANAADVSIISAGIEAGKLVVTGTTAAPNTRVRLDGEAAPAFNVTSGANGAFSFSLAYLPTDCVVSLQKLTLPSILGPANDVVVANCARGITPRGEWNPAAAYLTNDLVTRDGATWLARRNNTGRVPSEGASWQLFAAAGDTGQPGGDGSPGTEGDENEMRVPPTGPAGGDLTGTYPNPIIANFAVTGFKIAVGAVTASRIAAGAVTTLRIGDLAVTREKLANDSVGSAKVINNSLSFNDLAPNSVGASELADGAVDSAAVLDDTAGGGLQAADLASNSVGLDEIATDGVQATEIADNSIDSGEIVDNSLFASDLAADSIGGSELGVIVQRSAVSANIAGNSNGSVTASCLAGEQFLSGGNDGFFDVFVVASRQSGNGWRVFVRNNSGGNRTITAHVYCLQQPVF